MTEREAAQAVADAGRLLLTEKLVVRTWGNMSCRTGAGTFMITPSGMAYEHMTAQDVVAYRMEDRSWTGERKPSSERGIHAQAYRIFPDAGFVIHTHQTYASALGLAGFQPADFSPEEQTALGGISRAGYGLPGTARLRKNVTAALQTGAHSVLMAQHGALVVGVSAQETLARAVALENACKRLYRGNIKRRTWDEKTAGVMLREAGHLAPHIVLANTPAVLETAATETFIPAQLDDMAQMIGWRLPSVQPTKEAVLAGLCRHCAVLAPGIGAICRANNAEDAEALPALIEKACVCYLHTRTLQAKATLSLPDAALMWAVYQAKYSKKANGKT